MRLSCSIQSRAVCAALIVNSGVTLVAVGVAGYLAMTNRPRACPALPSDVRVVEVPLPEPPLPEPQWASSVRGFSSEYSTTSWSAMQTLGVPNVFPRHGDEAGAWASREPDAGTEFIELGFARPQRMRALEIYETYNPGAVKSVELITEQGTRIVEPRRELRAHGGAAVSSFGSTCTRERIAAVRIVVDSDNVAGWNEVDAVAMLPCQ